MDTVFCFGLRTFSFNKGEIRSVRQNLKFLSAQNDRMNSNGIELKLDSTGVDKSISLWLEK